jgi:carbonic anhydrase
VPDRLLAGFQHFRDTDLPKYKDLYRKLVDEGQHPRVLFIACSDSRIVPNLITEAGPGELFIIRTIGNIVTEDDGDATIAAVEFAVAVLGVSAIVVCGHSSCGAMQALYDAPDPEAVPHLAAWVEHARPAAVEPDRLEAMTVEERNRKTAQRNVLLALERIAAQPVVQGPRSRGELLVHGWYYDIAASELEIFDPETKDFLPSAALLPADAPEDATR